MIFVSMGLSVSLPVRLWIIWFSAYHTCSVGVVYKWPHALVHRNREWSSPPAKLECYWLDQSHVRTRTDAYVFIRTFTDSSVNTQQLVRTRKELYGRVQTLASTRVRTRRDFNFDLQRIDQSQPSIMLLHLVEVMADCAVTATISLLHYQSWVVWSFSG